LRAPHSLSLQPEGDIVAYAHPGKDALFLEHHRIEPPRASGRTRAGIARELDFALGLGIEPRHDAQQGGLAAARRAHDAEELAATNLEVDRCERGDQLLAEPEIPANPTQTNLGGLNRMIRNCGRASAARFGDSSLHEQRHQRPRRSNTLGGRPSMARAKFGAAMSQVNAV
jgi:hypothetical protein